jgi:hypothetical protein
MFIDDRTSEGGGDGATASDKNIGVDDLNVVEGIGFATKELGNLISGDPTCHTELTSGF